MNDLATSDTSRLFEAAFQASAIGMVLISPAGRCLRINQAAAKGLGYTPEEFQSIPLASLTHPADRQLDRSLLQELQDGQRDSYQLEKRYSHRDGSIVWGLTTVSAVRDDQGELEFLVVQIRDLTSLKRTLCQQQAFFDCSPELLSISDEEGILQQVNPAWSETLGWTMEELTSTPFLEFVHPQDRQATLAEAEKVRRGTPTPGFSNRYLTKAGGCRWLEWSSHRSEEGEIYSVAHDVTQQRAQEQQLRLQSRALEAASNGVLITDTAQPENPIVYANHAFQEITGYALDEIQGQSCRFLQRDDRQQPQLDRIRECIRAQQSCDLVLRNYRKDGSLFLNHLRLTPVADPSGAVTHFIGIVEDVTESENQSRQIREKTAFQDALLSSISSMGKGLAVTEGTSLRFANAALCRMLGYTEAELMALPSHLSLVAENERPRVARIHAKRMGGQAIESTYETALRHKSGERIEVAVAVTPIQMEGKFHTVAFIRDIRDEKKMERKLHEARQDLEEQVERKTQSLREAYQKLEYYDRNSPLAVIEWDSQLRVQHWSEKAEQLFDWRADQVMGRRPDEWKFVHPDDRAAASTVTRNLAKGMQKRVIFHIRNFTASGSELECEWYATALRDDAGKVVSILSLAHDITARIEAQEALRESEDQFRCTFEQAAVGIAHVSPEGRFLRVNERLCQILGYPAEELLALNFQVITHPDDLSQDLALAQEIQEGVSDSYHLEKRYFRKDGSLVWINLTVSLRRDSTGAPLHFISVVEDIQARKEAEFELKQAHTELDGRVAERTQALRSLNASLMNEVRVRAGMEKRVRESESQFRRLLENLPVMICYLDAQERFQYANRTCLNWLDMELQEIVDKPVSAIAGPAYPDLEPHLQRAYGGETVTYERWDRLDKAPIVLRATYIPEYTDERVEGVYVMVQDVTLEKERELQLKKEMQ